MKVLVWGGMIFSMLGRRDFKKAPSTPGIYFFRDRRGQVLYIGKAKNLRERLLSYADPRMLGLMKQKMLAEARKVEWRELESDIEALIEEALFIKRLRPPYNIVFRDDKQYFFVGFERSRLPHIAITHQKDEGKKFEYLGPFTDGTSLKRVLKMLQRLFPYCTCREAHSRPCVRSEIGRCLGVCCLREGLRESVFPDAKERMAKYRSHIRIIKTILRGKRKEVIRGLEREMKLSSRYLKFEQAQQLHDQISSLKNIFSHRSVIERELDPERIKALIYTKELLHLSRIPSRIEGYDISHTQGKDAVGSMVVFEEGKPKKSDYRLFKIRLTETPDDTFMLKEVLARRLHHREWLLPDLFLIDGGMGQLNAAKEILKRHNLAIPVVALAKREEELWSGAKRSIPLKKVSPLLLHLFQHIRNEAHRFAIFFHRRSRKKSLLAQHQ